MSENASGSHYDTPRKARIKGAVDFLDYKGLPYSKSEVFAVSPKNEGGPYYALTTSLTIVHIIMQRALSVEEGLIY